jgi:hypothetical protein
VVVIVAAHAHLRATHLEELPACDDDGDGSPRGDTQVLEQMDQEDHATTPFWLAYRPLLTTSLVAISEKSVSPAGRFVQRPV